MINNLLKKYLEKNKINIISDNNNNKIEFKFYNELCKNYTQPYIIEKTKNKYFLYQEDDRGDIDDIYYSDKIEDIFVASLVHEKTLEYELVHGIPERNLITNEQVSNLGVTFVNDNGMYNIKFDDSKDTRKIYYSKNIDYVNDIYNNVKRRLTIFNYIFNESKYIVSANSNLKYDLINIAIFHESKNRRLEDGMQMDYKNSRIERCFLNENDEMVDEQDAVKEIIRVYDKNNKMVEEIFGYVSKEQQEYLDDGMTFEEMQQSIENCKNLFSR